MSEPLIFGVPLTQMFLYFVWYSFLGWCMESTYCSIMEKHLINRGFLHLPLCPIYGAGVLIMVNFFTPFTGNPLLFYVMATVVMSAWEYFVGWLLEVTTHMKYWDYSHRRFNLKGRICLGNCLWWGVASYFVIYWIHPATIRLLGTLPVLARQITAYVLAAAVIADTVITIRDLALISKALAKAEEARVQLELGKKELQEQLDARKDALAQSLEAKKENLQQSLEAKKDDLQESLENRAERAKARLAALEERRSQMLAAADKHSRRFVRHYRTLSSRRYSGTLAELRRRAAERIKERTAK
ncbi:MAG: hypothetical protein SOW00_06205 [Oscillospiraceae bacterium]|nr:hypothetical protein [Eubacteriales bacterium]MDY2618372.1 hypothetical protein [Oscillospiraceae bacterium]